MCITFMYWI